ncbi:hypothetical protein ALC62_07394, partial [Cyphomyrmex costatus]
DIVEIKKTGRGKIMITVMTATGANRLVENSIFAKHNLKAFIPAFKVLRTGLIQDVPQQFDLDTIKEGLESPRAKILNIQRLNRKITIDNKTKYVPSRTIRIKFAGQILPKEVFLFKVKHEVRPYIPAPRICHRCYRVGHVNNSCKSNPRCKFCGDDSRGRDNDAGCQCNMQTEAPKCINCQGNHWANDRACPIVVKHRSVINTAAVENISIAEARIRIENGWVSSSSPNSPPFETNTRSFPNLLRDSRNSSSFESANRFGLLGAAGLDRELQSYADATRTQRQPQPPRNSRAAPRKGAFPEEFVRSSNRHRSHLNPHQQRYDEIAHRQALSEVNGRPAFASGNGIAFSNNFFTQTPTQSQSQDDGVGRSSNNTNASFAELLVMTSEIFSHFQNNNFSSAFNLIIQLVKNLSKVFFQPSQAQQTNNGSFRYPSDNNHHYTPTQQWCEEFDSEYEHGYEGDFRK